MKLQEPKNKNYCATVVEIKTLIPLANCDNVQHAIIMGNSVVVSKETEIGNIGLFFPVETCLSDAYLKANNLYRKGEMNADPTQKGYFEENGRIRCVKFRQNKSEGLFMPIHSLRNIVKNGENWRTLEEYKPTELFLGAEFDTIEGIEICKKYIPKNTRTPGASGNKKEPKEVVSKLVDKQFRPHEDTGMLYKNLFRFNPASLISITYKIHGTSGVSSYIICKKHVPKSARVIAWIIQNIFAPIINFLGGDVSSTVEDTGYDYVYSSRNKVLNEDLNSEAGESLYKFAHESVKDFLQKGMTFYYEIAGFQPSGSNIQGEFDYGHEPKTFGVYIYRITSTNIDGKVIEFSAKQVQEFCKANGLTAVPELFYGYAANFSDEGLSDEHWRTKFLETIKTIYNEKDCYMCKNKLPEEGVVIRIENCIGLQVFKCKSTRFLEWETKKLDKGETNMEDEN